MSPLVHILLPGGLVFVAAAVFLDTQALTAVPPALLAFIPPAMYAVGMLLSWRFNRSRIFLGFLAAGTGDWILQGLPQTSLAVDVVAVLLPLNVLLLTLAKERDVISLRGILRMAIIILQPLAVTLLARQDAEGMARALRQPFLPNLSTDILGCSQLSFLTLAGALAATGFFAMRRCDVASAGLFWMLSTSAVCWIRLAETPNLHVAIPAGTLCLLLAVTESAHYLAFRDELTGLPGRRALNEALKNLGSAYTIAMVDVDHFKRFNDRHGHDVGDQVLRKVATLIHQGTGGGRAFRYGGEEFALLYPSKKLERVVPHLDYIRESVSRSPFVFRGRMRPKKKPYKPRKSGKIPKVGRITVSIGAAERTGETSTPHDVIKAADKALYRAKRGGRNRVCS